MVAEEGSAVVPEHGHTVTPEQTSRPKKKRSYSVDADLCSDLELVAWWSRKSSSSVVEDLVREYLHQHAAELDEARSIAIAKARISVGKSATIPAHPPRQA